MEDKETTENTLDEITVADSVGTESAENNAPFSYSENLPVDDLNAGDLSAAEANASENALSSDDGKQPETEAREEHKPLLAEIIQPDQIDGDFLTEKPKIIYKLRDYEAPIELLYELIKSAKIAIEDIFISDVTSQYVQIIKDTPPEELDYEYAGEFITMAAELVYLKSVRTLPQDDPDDLDEDDPEFERMQLINKIKEYALIKEKTDQLRSMETINRFYRMPVYTDKDYRVALVNFSLPKLVEAFAKILANADRREQEVIPKKVMKDRFSVSDQMEYIRLMISVKKQMVFTDLFEPDYDKSDIVTTFLAVLELLKFGRLTAEQEEAFGEIRIFAVEGMIDMPLELEESEDGKY